MSRTYYEWMNAKHNWMIEQQRAISSLPYPDKNSIVYQRSSNNNFWERRRSHAENLIPSSVLSASITTYEDTLEFINAMGQTEENKEKAFLNSLNIDVTDTRSLIDGFNNVLQTKERYEALRKRIKAIQSKQKNIGLAPNLSALYGSYLHKQLQIAAVNFSQQYNPRLNGDQLKNIYNTEINNAITRTIDYMVSNINEDAGFGTGSELKELQELIHSDEYFKNSFVQTINERIGSESLNKAFNSIIENRSQKTGKHADKIMKQAINVRSQTASIGGNVVEHVMNAIIQALHGGGANFSTVIQGQGVKTDYVAVFNASTDARILTQELNDLMSENNGYTYDILQPLEDFLDHTINQMNDSYVVFVNAKNYSLTSQHSATFTDKQHGPLETLPSFLQGAGISVSNAQDFLLTAYNAADGAIRSGMQQQIIESCVEALKAAAAKIMFDDYQTLGKENRNGIHLFMLDGMYIPSSVIFKSMASVKKQATVKGTIHFGKINDVGPDANGYGSGNDAQIKQAIYDYWSTEFNRIKTATTWKANFTLKIKSILSSYV